MKNSIKSLLLTTLFIVGVGAATISSADVQCTGTKCEFSKLTDQKDQNPFYCDVKGSITKVNFSNHAVLITGFNKDGELTLDGPAVALLLQRYFDAIRDKDDNGYVVASVQGGGEFNCHPGKGGRGEKWPGDYGKGK